MQAFGEECEVSLQPLWTARRGVSYTMRSTALLLAAASLVSGDDTLWHDTTAREEPGPGECGAPAFRRIRYGYTLEGCTTLRMPKVFMGPEGAETLAEQLATNTELMALDVEETSIGALGAKALAHALKSNSNSGLVEINVKRNAVGAEGARSLAGAIASNGKLEFVGLWDNAIGDEGAKSIAEALKTNRVVNSLILGSNGIGDAGAKAIAEALAVNRGLVFLSLARNAIGDEGAMALAEAIKGNGVLNGTSIWKNQMSDQATAALQAVLDVPPAERASTFPQPKTEL